ncbi:MAG: type IV pilus twitching motility protein PilT [Lachnospiraceae bacterium]
MTLNEFIAEARKLGASDIHLTVGAPTVIRVNGELRRYGEFTDVEINRMIHSILSADQEVTFTQGKDIDFSFQMEDGSMQRANVYHQDGKAACAIRLLNTKVPSLDALNMPAIISRVATERKGLILVTGSTGSGKTTTMASIIDSINHTRPCHIVTIEDPIEYVYESALATIHQREVGKDVESFNTALKSVLREDPDVILIGEMRDFETVSLALTAAETGHLVLATLHTASAAQTIDRIIDVCPVDVREQVRVQFSNILQAIIAQALVPKEDGSGRVAALEILLGTEAVKNLIRSNKVAQINSTMQTSTRIGMCTLNDSLAKLYKDRVISYETALEFASDKAEVEKTMRSGSIY